MRFIETFREKDSISGIFFCRHKTVALSKAGKEYASIILQDKTGNIDGKIWNLGSVGIREFDVKDYVYVKGEITTFNGQLQFNIAEIRIAEPGTYNEADYLPTSSRDIEEMYTELLGELNKVKDTYLAKLISRFFKEDENFIKEFKRHSAAKRVHHGFMGGLLEHSLGVVKLCADIGDKYTFLNRDLLVTAAVFHDVGKLYELSDFPDNDYTDEGQMLGHIMIGYEVIAAAIREIPDFPKNTEVELKHCILAHHGEYEFGSPKKPAIPEALVIHMADEIDSKLEIFKEALNTPAAINGEWLGFNKFLDSNIRKSMI